MLFPPRAGSGAAIGTLNFFGDVGKVLFPVLTGFLLVEVGWRGSCGLLGGIGVVVGLLYLLVFRHQIAWHARQRKEQKKEQITAKKEKGGWRNLVQS
ncbi:MAG: MFS transporter [Candidatus Latescibacterota bacterium]